TSDGRFVVTASRDGTVRVWALPRARSIFALTHDDEIYGAKWSSDGQLILTASSDGSAHVWDSNGKLLSKLVGHSCEMISAEFSPNSEVLVTGDDDGAVKAWHTRTGEPFLDLPGHTGPVTAIAFNPIDNERLVTASADGTAFVQRLVGGVKPIQLARHTDSL